MHNDPLIVPADLALGQLEDLLLRLSGKSGVLTQVVDNRVMKMQECRVKLSKDHVFVIPAISENGGIVGVTREVETGGAIARDGLCYWKRVHAQLDLSGAQVIQLRGALRPIAVHAVKIECSGAEVRRFLGVAWFEQQGSWVERDIVVQELTQEGDASRHVGIVGIVWTEYRGIRDGLNGIGHVIQRVDDASFFAQLFGLGTCLIGRRGVGRQVRKHACKGIVLSGRPFPQSGKV